MFFSGPPRGEGGHGPPPGLLLNPPLIVTPLIKKPALDKELLSNYRPISNLSFLSKLTERIVLQRLSAHLSSNDLFNKHQSAYTKHRSTETVLLSVCNTITNAMSTQRLTGLYMLGLSAAFDTI